MRCGTADQEDKKCECDEFLFHHDVLSHGFYLRILEQGWDSSDFYGFFVVLCELCG